MDGANNKGGEMGQEKELAKKETEVVQKGDVEQANASPAEMAVVLLSKGVKPEDLEKMLALQERYEANQARKAYCEEMALVQQSIPKVKKTLENKQTGSMYAGLDDIIHDIKQIYTERGFSVSFYEGDSPLEGHIRVLADVRHRRGHKETYHYDMPLDGKGIKGNVNMTPIHAKGSSTSYARRYLMCMIWNIPTGDDDDGNEAGGTETEYIDEQQLNTLVDTIGDTGADMGRFVSYMGIATLAEMPKRDFNRAIIALNSKKKKAEAKKHLDRNPGQEG